MLLDPVWERPVDHLQLLQQGHLASLVEVSKKSLVSGNVCVAFANRRGFCKEAYIYVSLLFANSRGFCNEVCRACVDVASSKRCAEHAGMLHRVGMEACRAYKDVALPS